MNTRRLYETTFIVNAALEDQDIDSVVSKVRTYIENHGGEINEINRWGRRRLTYPINKKFNGFYVNIIFNAGSDILPIIERFLVLEDTVLRHLTLQLSEKLRQLRLEKAQAEGKQGSGTYISEAEEGKVRRDNRDKRENRENKDNKEQAVVSE